jgi:hypothetical protein
VGHFDSAFLPPFCPGSFSRIERNQAAKIPTFSATSAEARFPSPRINLNRREKSIACALSAAEQEQKAAMLTLLRLGWGQENPAFRQLFTSQFFPGGTKEQADWFNERNGYPPRPKTQPAP